MAAVVFGCLGALGQSMGGYSGPQILSRGDMTGSRGGAPAGFTFYAGVYGSYETGLVPASVDAKGNIVNPSSLYGVGIRFGAYGRRTWRRTTVGLDYAGNVRHYSADSYYDGSDHMLALQVLTRLTRKVSVFSMTSAGTISQYYAGGPAYAANLLSTPGYSLFDNRMYYLETGAGLNYQWNSRLSFGASGTGFFVRRQSDQLVGMNGWSVQGSASYRLTRTRTLIFDYARAHYDYPRGFGETDVDSLLAGITQAFGRRWTLGVSAGASHIGTIGVEQIATDPVTAALFGITATTQAFDSRVWIAAGRAVLDGRFKRSSFDLSVTQLPNGGNGVYLTSKSTAASATYSYTGIRRASMYANFTFNSLSSIGQQDLGTFSYFSAGVGGSYRFRPYLEANAEFTTRNLQIDQTNGFSRLSYRVLIGINFHPGEFPVALW